MNRFAFAMMLVMALAYPAMAQEVYPAVELGVGYSLLDDNKIDADGSGFVASATGNVTRWFGVESEFGGNFDLDVWSYVGGPRLTLRTERTSPYVHVLIGGVHQSVSPAGYPGFGAFEAAAQAGGGVNFRMTPRTVVNVGGDYRKIYGDFDVDRNEVRFHIGLVFGFGGRF
jgi:opacity protein-like surface antigen